MKTFLLYFDMWIFKEVQAFSISDMMGVVKSWKSNENEWCVGRRINTVGHKLLRKDQQRREVSG